ncbi:helix-turn-helix domain-containing protein [Phragmitibacter flavus]|uniref:Helix-turn-helix domain-containing protein n=1 Tax=Phragmitibacter flavus TaxID=2576071 RepID=A0A5R8KFX5_9BACT|nr:AraC family transcriptional regulator [Phragmitibacter flavus]TLD71217.1 helix-turn-helix domain-containing protein [Phragmitibacter flavus]
MMNRTALRQPILEQVPPTPQASFLCEVVKGTGYGALWHFHPEHQITLVLKSKGYRIVGDSMERLKPGDLVLVGSNLPHVWHQDETAPKSDDAVHAIVIRFLDNFMGADFMQRPELEAVRGLLRKAGRGLRVTGQTRVEAEARLLKLVECEGLARLIELLGVLELLAHSCDLTPLSSPTYQATSVQVGTQGRMHRVLQYIHANLSEEIDRDEVARRANLSEGAFSRFFKARTGRTLPQYVNELRIGRACLLLAETDRKVVEVAAECGFENLANFNRQFLKTTHKTPRDWRREFQQSSGM